MAEKLCQGCGHKKSSHKAGLGHCHIIGWGAHYCPCSRYSLSKHKCLECRVELAPGSSFSCQDCIKKSHEEVEKRIEANRHV